MTSKGVIYFATNKECYVDEAVKSAQSVKSTSPDLQVAVFSNLVEYAQRVGAGVFDQVILMEPQVKDYPELLFIDKIQAILDSPFEHTLYLDADTHVFRDLGDMFRLLERFQVVITNGHNRRLRDQVARGHIEDHKGRKRAILPEDTPMAFGPVQGGFLLYNGADKAVQAWLTALMARYKEDDFYDDQVTMRSTLWEAKDVSVFCLPEEYNFTGMSAFKRWRDSGFKIAVPHILHYTEHKDNPWPFIEKIKPYANALPEASSSEIKGMIKKLRGLLQSAA